SHISTFNSGITYANLFDLAQERVQKGIINTVLHVDASSSGTVLATVDVTTYNSSISSSFNIGILIDDKWGFAAKFEVHMLNGVCCCTHNMLTTLSAACNRSHAYITKTTKRLLHAGTTSNDAENSSSKTSSKSQLTKFHRADT